MENRYKNWKLEPFPENQTNEEILIKINQLIKGLNIFYGLTGMQGLEAEAIYEYLFQYLKNFKMFKLIDMDRAFELFRRPPELNKLTPAYFESILNTYRKSKERELLILEWNNDAQGRLETEKKTFTKEELLMACFEMFEKTGQILINSGAVYEMNFKAISEALGQKTMKDIAEVTKTTLVQNLEAKRHGFKFMSEHHELEAEISEIIGAWNRYLETGKFKNGGLLQVEIRKAHLKHYFQATKSS